MNKPLIAQYKTFLGKRDWTVGSVPEGLDAIVLKELTQIATGAILFLAHNETRLAEMSRMLSFFDPNIQRLSFPPWDCLPYDRVSPNREILAQRLDVLCDLATNNPTANKIILTTVGAALQRVPSRKTIAAARLTIQKGSSVDRTLLLEFLINYGYFRSGIVHEPGEFAVRGSLIDLFVPNASQPTRLDLFGDVVESIRSFDSLSQRTTKTLHQLMIGPANEIVFDEDAVARFRAGYTSFFGVPKDDPLYEAVCSRQHHIGMEHWLPLFHDKMETIFDYVPGALVVRDHLAESSRTNQLNLIHDNYDARASEKSVIVRDIPYRPLPMGELYVDDAEWIAILKARSVATVTPFTTPDEEKAINVGGRPGHNFFAEHKRTSVSVFEALKQHIDRLHADSKKVIIASHTESARERLQRMLTKREIKNTVAIDNWQAASEITSNQVGLALLELERGFETDELAIIGEQDILGPRKNRTPRRTRSAEHFINEISSINQGDLVVHIDHGIGRYIDLQTIKVNGAPHDCLCIEYAGGDRLLVPVENIEVLSRFGSSDKTTPLDKLGSAGWQARKAKAKKRIREIAGGLIKVAAERAVRELPPLKPAIQPYQEFCARFPYHETEDQVNAIADVLGDLAAGKPLDRLICGDVGFGKTEVALRTAYTIAMNGQQVAVIVPTTLLCRQHLHTFKERFSNLPVRISQLSRLVDATDAKNTRQGIANGEIDIVIGTHSLLGKDINFANLALVIIDEEQKFGVAHKERLKALRDNVHVLTLTATPIPRTLQMALSGIRELSLIATPPVDRLSVRTFILPFDPLSIRDALIREHSRQGQSFFVCPRIADIKDASTFLRETVPELSVAIAHGQLAPRKLDSVMQSFYENDVDILLSTNIVESGLDLPAANTLVVYRADRFGLAQLYQLRGRIGRGKRRAFAYLTLPPRIIPTASAERRLQVMQSLDKLGAGFSLASHDLDIRGAGNLLGSEQSGHIREVGFELYQQMLEEAVATLRSTERSSVVEIADTWSPQISVGVGVLIPDTYVEDLAVRLGLYRRLSRLATLDDIETMTAELIDRFGPLPDEVGNLLEVVAIKLHCRIAGIEKLDAGPKGLTLSFRNNSYSNPSGLIDYINLHASTVSLKADHRLIFRRNWEEAVDRLAGVHMLVKKLAKMAT